MTVQIDASGDSVKKYGEVLCGDRVEIVRDNKGITAMLADGTGGGAKSNILSSLAAKMMSTMLNRGESIEKITDMIVESQPAGREEGVSYSAFTLIQVIFSGKIFIAQLETPDVLLFQRGKPVPMETRREIRQGRLIRVGVSDCKKADTVVAVSNGVLGAGVGLNLKKGWRMEHISTFLANAYHPRITSEKLVRLLLNVSGSLSSHRQKDDLSAVAIRIG